VSWLGRFYHGAGGCCVEAGGHAGLVEAAVALLDKLADGRLIGRAVGVEALSID